MERAASNSKEDEEQTVYISPSDSNSWYGEGKLRGKLQYVSRLCDALSEAHAASPVLFRGDQVALCPA